MEQMLLCVINDFLSFCCVLFKELTKAIEDSWAANFGCMCVGVNWELFPSAVDDAKVCARF